MNGFAVKQEELDATWPFHREAGFSLAMRHILFFGAVTTLGGKLLLIGRIVLQL